MRLSKYTLRLINEVEICLEFHSFGCSRESNMKYVILTDLITNLVEGKSWIPKVV